ncbi:cytochrome c biogenesis protein CcsA [Verrucomicrobiales bacterium]|nr:cytochrome c biogenesis protein CcsA [Verrucomicrobiales bacterium]MDA7666046.1 cytochrome c biogenesis protein CcsA [bacterium]
MKLTLAFLIALLAIATNLHGEADYWPEEFVRGFSELPVKDDGRVKPMDTFARVTLISIHGRSKHTLNKEERIKISADEWLLDVFFRPEVAQDYPTFQVNNAEVLTALGIAPHLKENGRIIKRDYYAYNEIVTGRQKLAELSEKYSKVKDSSRTVVQQQIVDLAASMSRFEGLNLLFKFAQHPLPLDPEDVLAEDVPEGKTAPLSVLFDNLPKIQEAGRGTAPLQRSSELLGAFIQSSTMVALLPPLDGNGSWANPGELMQAFIEPSTDAETRPKLLEQFKLLENLAIQSTNDETRQAALNLYQRHAVGRADALGEYDAIASEVKFYKWKNLLLGPWLYVVGFLILAGSWLSPHSRVGGALRKGAFTWLWVPTLLLVVGITWRCILRSRPPVTSLYETILFVTAVGVIILLIAEGFKKNGLALALVPFMGAAGLFLAMRFELADGQDTIKPLVAVLDTNYWLATHVTTVTMGYAAGLAAAALSILYVLSRLTDPMKTRLNRRYYRELTGMTYGVICFGLLFSLVGTILGGIWANESWGRFWGWDPKENGALMIVLMNLILLHGRIGGYLKELRLHLATLFGGIVVCYSWWGVNLLETGLHSYGFVSGVQTALDRAYFTFYAFIVFGVCVGIFEWAVKRTASHNPHQQSGGKEVLAVWAVLALVGAGILERTAAHLAG